MSEPTRDEITQAAEAMVEAYLSTRYPPEELTLGTEPGYHLARALLSAFEREDKIKKLIKAYIAKESSAWVTIGRIDAAIKAAEEGR